jgi:hypothetical protein
MPKRKLTSNERDVALWTTGGFNVGLGFRVGSLYAGGHASVDAVVGAVEAILVQVVLMWLFIKIYNWSGMSSDGNNKG